MSYSVLSDIVISQRKIFSSSEDVQHPQNPEIALYQAGLGIKVSLTGTLLIPPSSERKPTFRNKISINLFPVSMSELGEFLIIGMIRNLRKANGYYLFV